MNDNFGAEKELHEMLNLIRIAIPTTDYPHIILGLVFLRFLSTVFTEHYTRLDHDRPHGVNPEHPEAYRAANTFWLPKEARWAYLKQNARQPHLGQSVDDAIGKMERENPSLKGILPRGYHRLAPESLGRLINYLDNFHPDPHLSSGVFFAHVYESFLVQLATLEGKNATQVLTPPTITRLLITMLEPTPGLVYDPCCGSGGTFVQLQNFIKEFKDQNDHYHSYGQELNISTWQLCKMFLTIRGINGSIAHGDTLSQDLYPDLRADYLISNPPFNDPWRGNYLQDDPRWKFGIPPSENANYAWIQHAIYHLSPSGRAGLVLSNNTLASANPNDMTMRKKIIEADLIDCIVALPGQLLYTTQIPICLWLMSRDKTEGAECFRERRGEILFMDARSFGVMRDRSHRELTPDEIGRVSSTYHLWRGKYGPGTYTDIPGFCKAVPLDIIRQNAYNLTPGRYIDIPSHQAFDEPFDRKMARQIQVLKAQLRESRELDTVLLEILLKMEAE